MSDSRFGVNFGWLNDYTGSRFSPIVLGNNVIMGTEGDSSTLVDYLNGLTNNMLGAVTKNQKVSDAYGKIVTQLIYEEPQWTDSVTGQKQPLEPLGVIYAKKLTAVNVDGGGIEDKKGLEVGSDKMPIYFSEGVPKICIEKGTNGTRILSIGNYPYISTEVIEEEVPIIGVTDGGTSRSLDINISGIANHADFSNEARLAEYAKNAENTVNSYNAYNLTQNINIGQANGVIAAGQGDIQGIIETCDQKHGTDNDQVFATELILKPVAEGYAGNYGQKYKTNTAKGTLYVPSFKLDKKGRIIEAEDYQYVVDLQMYRMSNRSDLNKAYLLTVNAPEGSPNYIYSQGSKASQDIYIEWGTKEATEPILMGAAWNDYAEYRNQVIQIESGYCVKSNDDGRVERTTERLSICDGVVSDTFGFSIGKTETYKTPLAVSGRVLAYCEGNREDYHAGDVVCASENGKVCKMTREEISQWPDRIVGTVSEIPNYDTWNNKKINGRIWIKVK